MDSWSRPNIMGPRGPGSPIQEFGTPRRNMQDPELAKTAPTIPKNATYINHDILNEIIELMSQLVTEHIKEETLFTQNGRNPRPNGLWKYSYCTAFC